MPRRAPDSRVAADSGREPVGGRFDHVLGPDRGGAPSGPRRVGDGEAADVPPVEVAPAATPGLEPTPEPEAASGRFPVDREDLDRDGGVESRLLARVYLDLRLLAAVLGALIVVAFAASTLGEIVGLTPGPGQKIERAVERLGWLEPAVPAPPAAQRRGAPAASPP